MKKTWMVVAALIPTAACTPGDTFDVQIIETRDAAQPSVVYYSNRDVGASVRLSGTTSNGRPQTRDLWLFGDSGGFDAAGNGFSGAFFPTNSAALVTPKALGASPPVAPMPSAVTKNPAGQPLAFQAFLSGGTAYPVCEPGEYAAHWITSAVRLPDADPRRETALIFYQNWCVRLSPESYRAFDGGVAAMTWDANAPDAAPTATVLSDRLFAPGRFVNQWWPAGLAPGGTYGAGAHYKPGSSNELTILQCGTASHCTSAHWIYDPTQTVEANLDRVQLRASWSYRVEGLTTSHGDDEWRPFPPVDPNPDDDCTPSSEEACAPAASHPIAKRVLTASSDPLTQVWGAPSVAVFGRSLAIVYMPGPPAGSASLQVDHAALRLAVNDGIFSGPVRANLPAGHCTPLAEKGCYAPVLHSELNHGDWLYFSYYARGDLTLPNGARIGSLRIGRTCLAEFTGASC
jgi:hypothetical protein